VSTGEEAWSVSAQLARRLRVSTFAWTSLALTPIPRRTSIANAPRTPSHADEQVIGIDRTAFSEAGSLLDAPLQTSHHRHPAPSGPSSIQRAGDEDRLRSSTDFPKIDTEASERDLVFLAKGLILGDVSKIFDEPLLERRDRLR
jgi:hypothetical protein